MGEERRWGQKRENPDPKYNTEQVKSGVLPACFIGRDDTVCSLRVEAQPVSISVLQFSTVALTAPYKRRQRVSGANTWDVSGDFSEGRLSEALGCAGSNRD